MQLTPGGFFLSILKRPIVQVPSPWNPVSTAQLLGEALVWGRSWTVLNFWAFRWENHQTKRRLSGNKSCLFTQSSLYHCISIISHYCWWYPHDIPINSHIARIGDQLGKKLKQRAPAGLLFSLVAAWTWAMACEHQQQWFSKDYYCSY